MSNKISNKELGALKPFFSDSPRVSMSNGINNVTVKSTEPKSFASVVRTTMIIKNWMLSIQQKEDFDMKNTNRMSEINTSLVFNPSEMTQFPATYTESPTVDMRVIEVKLESGIKEMNMSPNLTHESPLQPVVAPELPPLPIQNESKLIYLKNKIIPVFKSLILVITDPIDASHDFYYYWSFVIYVAFLYNAFMCVIFVFESTTEEFYKYWLILNGLVDFIYIVDIVINAKLCYMDQGLSVKDWDLLLKNYISSAYFKFDVAAILPFDFILLIWPTFCLVRVNRLFKFYKVNEYIQKQNIRTNFPNAFRIFHIFIICCTLFHWNSAAYFEISLNTGINSTLFGAWEFNYAKIADPLFATCDVWLNDENNNCNYQGQVEADEGETRFADSMMQFWKPKTSTTYYSTFTKQYILSMYWSSLTLTTSGQQPYPTRSSHNFLEIFDTIIGMLIFAVIVGSVGNVVAFMNKDKTDFQNLMDGLKFYMTYRDVQSVVQRRVKDVVAYIQKYGMINDEASTMIGLPRRLKGELAVHLHMENLKRVRLLRGCEPSLLYELVLRMKMQMFAPNDMLCRRGEIAKEMFIVKRGTLEMLAEKGRIINQLKEGSSFGELAILKVSGGNNANRQTRSLRSVGYSDVYVLQQDDALEVLQDYPKQRNKLIEKAKQMMRQQQQSEEIGEFIEDQHEFSGIKNTDEILLCTKKSLISIDAEISAIQHSFMTQSSALKQRVTHLENMYYKNRRRIREVNAERLAQQLQM